MSVTGHSGRSTALRRRLVTVPLLLGTWAACLAALPVLLVMALAVDVTRGARRVPSVRLVGFVAAYLTYESAGVAAAAWLWLSRPLRPRQWEEQNRRLQRWWTRGLIRVAGPVLGLRLEVEAHGPQGDGPVIVASRHVSVVDSLLPAHLLGVGEGRHLRYVLTKGLRLDPCLDIVGHRLPNHFVDRGAEDSGADLAAIERLGRGLGTGDAVVIFPEGALSTPGRRARAVARLDAGGSARADLARALRHLLPPRPAGTLALLRAAPDADVVLLAHHGFEPLGSLKHLWRVLPLAQPVRLRMVRHPRRTLPDDAAGQLRWLDEQWRAMDRWLAEAAAGPTGRSLRVPMAAGTSAATE